MNAPVVLAGDLVAHSDFLRRLADLPVVELDNIELALSREASDTGDSTIALRAEIVRVVSFQRWGQI